MDQIGIRLDRIQKRMEELKITSDQQLARGTIFQRGMARNIRKGLQTPNALMLASLAQRLGVSTEYLLGMTDNPAPTTIRIEGRILDLVQLASELHDDSLADLVEDAEAYVEDQKDDIQMMDAVLREIEDLGGHEAAEQILDLLESLRPPFAATLRRFRAGDQNA